MEDSYSDKEFLKTFVEEAYDFCSEWEECCLELFDSYSESTANSLFRCAHNLKGSSRAVGLIELGEFIHVVEDAINMMRNQRSVNEGLIEILLESQNVILSYIKAISNQEKPNTNGFANIKQRIEKNITRHHELQSHTQQQLSFGIFTETNDQDRNEPSDHTRPKGSRSSRLQSKDSTTDSVRVSASVLDNIIQQLGELSIQHSILVHEKNEERIVSTSATTAIMLADKIIKTLEREAVALRMQKVSQLFKKLKRTAFDISKKLEKDISVVLEGTEVELDKAVLQRISDPLVHLVRNAIDHGIEAKGQRDINKKSLKGTIKIVARNHSDSVVISVSDDGGGIIAEKILKKAIEKGLIDPNFQGTERDILNLIFLPGFSTGEVVTDISGRGVGMDVVKTAVEELNGKVDIESRPGSGTTFSITLPTMLSIFNGIVVLCSGEPYVLQTSDISEVISIKSSDIKFIEANRFGIDVRGQVATLIDPKSIFNRSKKNVGYKQETFSRSVAIVLKEERQLYALVVDDVINQQRCIFKQVKNDDYVLPSIAGGTILGEGQLAYILDKKGLIEAYQSLQRK